VLLRLLPEGVTGQNSYGRLEKRKSGAICKEQGDTAGRREVAMPHNRPKLRKDDAADAPILPKFDLRHDKLAR
jgi:hypothetical protein